MLEHDADVPPLRWVSGCPPAEAKTKPAGVRAESLRSFSGGTWHSKCLLFKGSSEMVDGTR